MELEAKTPGAIETEGASARPVSIGDQFGWFHPAQGDVDAQPKSAVVLCGAFGVEMMCAHQGWRQLAERLAAAGLPTLRFDYAGVGDSVGDDRDPDRVGAWRRGVDAAMDALRTASGAARVMMIGLRFGALIAASAAAERDDVSGFVALAPVVSGRFYMRELGALSRFGRFGDGARDADDAGGMGVNGFFISDETQDALKLLDARKFAHAPATQTLIVGRNDGAEADLAEKWRSDGAAVETVAFDGYDAFMDGPTTTVAPADVWRRIVDWCASAPAPTAPAPQRHLPATSFGPPSFAGDGWREDAVQFGAGGRLFGMLARPAEGCARENDVAVVILNAGRNHHIGWGRGAVEMARDLAQNGVASFRIDAAGIGDSPPWPNGPAEVLYAPEQKDDLKAALDRLNAFGYRRFVLVGSCGGAYLALQGALADARIAGFALINLLRFHWGPHDNLADAMDAAVYRPTESYVSRLVDPAEWRRILRGEIAVTGIARALLGRGVKTIRAIAAERLARIGIGKSETVEAANWFRTLEARGVKMRLIYSAEDPGLAELAHYFGPGGRSLRALCSAEIDVVQNADHNLSQRNARLEAQRLVKELVKGV